MQNHWHAKTIPQVLDILKTSDIGLSKEECASRLKEYGQNKLPESKADNILIIFLRQFQSPLIYILLACSVVIFIMDSIVDASIILAILIFNSFVGSIQEGRAQNTLLALKKFAETTATVLRDGKELVVQDFEVVPGDIIILQEGEKVPADARIIISHSLGIDEAELTGESEPIYKISETIKNHDLPTTEQKNMIFKGTRIVSGNGKAIVVATGVKTVIGKISKEIEVIDTEIPLKTNVRYLSRLIIITVVAISSVLFFSGIILGKSAKDMFATVVSLSVSIIPEGLPIVMTLVLATGVWRMTKQNVVVKKLQAVEALGQTRVIAVDKTGTITKNELMVQQIYVNKKLFDIGGAGYEPKGEIRFADKIIDPLNHEELLLSGKIAALCANARIMFFEETQQWRISGDPTEAAMLVFAEKIGFHKDNLENESQEIMQIPFNYKTRYHATAHLIDEKTFLTVAGAPETILSLSSKIWLNGKSNLLTPEEKLGLENVFITMSQEGMRVVAFAMNNETTGTITSDAINNLTFVGFFAMRDTLRPEVEEAMARAISAGIKVIMITGDHKITAQAIAKKAGIYHDGDQILTGTDIDELSDQDLSEMIIKTSVFARVTPEHKIKIVQAYKQKGEIVAMTGDGVNDAPSLVAADLGVAMGKIGTEVAKEASDIILLDDNFGSIISAIEEGRSIYKTIKKVILYLFSTSCGEVLTITGAILLEYPLPILPAQIIWLNFVTDGFLDVALAMEPKEKGLLNKNFERPKKYLIDKLMAYRMLIMAIPMAIGTLYLFKGYFETDITKAWTIALTTLAMFQWLNAWNCKSENKSILQINPLSNKFLIGATVIVVALQLFIIYNPVAQKLLHTTSLSMSEWLIIIPVAATIVLVEEIRKLFYRINLQTINR